MGHIHSYKAGDVEVRFDTARCIHSAACVRGLPQVFDTAKTPWVQPGQADPEQVKEAVLRCPTGALTFLRNGQVEEPAGGPAQVRVVPDGPFLLRGDLQLAGGAETRLALCRCGASARKPLCDGAHRSCGFKDPGAVAPQPGSEAPAGPLSLNPAPDGPLLLKGPAELLDGQGHSAGHLAQAALCRCGASANKPFCDGSHRTCGFKG